MPPGQRPGAKSYRDKSDDVLARACLEGREEAWDALIERYRRLIYSIPIKLGLPVELADEAFQHVALALLEHLPEIRDIQGLPAWISVTARRESWRLLKQHKRHEPLDHESRGELPAEPGRGSADEGLHRLECAHALTLALERLGEPCESLLRALYMEDPAPTYEELASRLGRPIGSLGPTRARCLSKLSKLYRQAGGPSP